MFLACNYLWSCTLDWRDHRLNMGKGPINIFILLFSKVIVLSFPVKSCNEMFFFVKHSFFVKVFGCMFDQLCQQKIDGKIAFPLQFLFTIEWSFPDSTVKCDWCCKQLVLWEAWKHIANQFSRKLHSHFLPT